MSEMVTTTATTTSTGVTMVIETTGVDPMFLLKIVKLLLGMVEILWHELKICCKMMRRFNASNENIKELRSDLAGIGQKVDTHAISIKQIKLQIAQLSGTVNTWKPSTLPRNTVQNTKNDGHSMAITTRGGKQTIDSPMPSNEEKVRKDNDKVVEGSGEVEDSIGKDAEVPIKVIAMPRPPLSSEISEKDRGW